MLRLAVVLFAVVMFQAEPPEAYPGQHQHAEPPKGWFCSPTAKVKAHECHCKRMTHATTDDPVCEDTHVAEDAQCSVYCHMDHCLCPVTCSTDHHPKP